MKTSVRILILRLVLRLVLKLVVEDVKILIMKLRSCMEDVKTLVPSEVEMTQAHDILFILFYNLNVL